MSRKTGVICPRCRTRPRHVSETGSMMGYCLECNRKISRDNYRDNPSVRRKVNDRNRKRYHKDPEYRAKVNRACRDNYKTSGYARTDRFRLSAIKSHMLRLTGEGMESMVNLVDDELRQREAKIKKAGDGRR